MQNSRTAKRLSIRGLPLWAGELCTEQLSIWLVILRWECMKKFRTAIRFSELTEAEKNRINDALDEARERAGVKRLTQQQIREVTETVKFFILRERQRIKEAKEKKEQQIKASAETEFNWSASVKRPVRR